jgi:hypothetical protein
MKIKEIISESIGDSTLSLDQIASKYLGSGMKWDQTHFRNILDKVEPPSEQLKLALRLDGDNGGDITDTIISNILSGGSSWKPFAQEMKAFVSGEDYYDDGGGAAWDFCNYLVSNSQEIEYSDADEYSTYFLFNGKGFNFFFERNSMQELADIWYEGSPAPVIRFIKAWLSAYNKTH